MRVFGWWLSIALSAQGAPAAAAGGSDEPSSAGSSALDARDASPTPAGPSAPAREQGSTAGEARICVIVPREPPAVLQEAHHRIVAELRAVGFRVDTLQSSGAEAETMASPAECAGAAGLLELQPRGNRLTILAAAPDEDPLQQRMDLASARTTAEVIAIRAVEGLRAALIQTMRKTDGEAEDSPAAVREFVHYGSLTPDEPTGGKTLDPPQPEEAKPKGSSKPPRTLPFLTTFGPTLTYDGGSAGLGLELLAAWRLGIVSIGALMDASLVPGELQLVEGTVAFRQYSLSARLAGELPCPGEWVCQLGVDFGLRQISIEASPSDTTSVAEAENHTSAQLAGDVLVGYFFGEHFGVGGRFHLGALLDAPTVGASSGEYTWGRPSAGGTLSVMGRF